MCRVSLFALLLITAPLQAATTDTGKQGWFDPTPAEWAAWPDYCRARYASLDFGRTKPFAAQYPRASIDSWRQSLGKKTFVTLHHYCAGLFYMDRAAASSDDKERRQNLNRAELNINHSFLRLPPGTQIYNEAKLKLDLVRLELASLEERKKWKTK